MKNTRVRPKGIAKRPPSAKRSRSLANVQPADLFDRDRLANLYQRAVDTGVVDTSERTRLNFYAAACQARKGENPPALFAWIINGKQWRVLTDEAEESARVMMKPCGGRSSEPSRERAESITMLGTSYLVHRVPARESKGIRSVLAGILANLEGR